MYLRNFIKKLDKKYHKVFFSGIAYDSILTKKGYIFFAIKGDNFDGNNYIQEAIKKGATIVVSEKKKKLSK